MKCCRILPVAIALLSTQLMYAGDNGYPEIAFEETTHNFKLFDREHAVQTCWFKFKNTGTSQLVIQSANGTCSCTQAEAPANPVEPGATDSIKVTFNGTDIRPGVIRKTVIVTSNIKEKTAYLYITGELVDHLVEERVEKADDAAEKSE